MCGIAGFTAADERSIRAMTDIIAHRGPDDSGILIEPGLSLGHRRLSIIDLSECGHQPMLNEDGSIVVVYNGEIYNSPELRHRLEAKGHRFRGHCDTEVIAPAYQEYGPACVTEFQGMFAFALWDRNRRRLLLARDRIGIKPLYYYHHGYLLIFASEVKAILEHPDVPREVDEQALFEYLGYEFVPAPRTLFRGIRKLRQGHTLIFENGMCKEEPYWDLHFEHGSLSPREEERRLAEILETAVRRRLLSDVPVGAFLSGGLDSSALVGFMSRHMKETLRTYTIGYEDPTFSELPYARIVSRHVGSEHHELMIDPLTPERIRKAVWHLDEPMTDLSSVPLMLISERARRDVKVCLSGEGGDELFMGYDRFRASRLNHRLRPIPAPLRRLGFQCVAVLPDQPQKKGMINMLKRFAEGALLPEDGEHMRWQYFLNADIIQKLFQSDYLRSVDAEIFAPIRRIAEGCAEACREDREVYIDIRMAMADSVLMKVDKMSMATSLEVRVPFLDHEFVEFSAMLHPSRKLHGMTTKAIFREAMRDLLPPEIVGRGKQGYSIPIKNWLREDLRDFMVATITQCPLVHRTLRADAVNSLIDEHLSRRHNHNHILWALINLSLWYETFIHRSTAAAASHAG
ncbi:MAG: asparagine synthase (glutamine-hydrolyzing) [Candidatus Eisenbacteria bacterium]|uniref:asparagine synthase (glutamine-hydrolyzing) n=1 Tax=Eiseniibacteriota bacterium TaxID=2212470 RepID=A0A948RR37_UNCEI|nr:asparagine synthase (glutamine-hydrolyzing) [Candidatus Eisenbacteria bacterium]